MSWLDDLLGKIISVSGVQLPQRKILNFIAGDSGVNVAIADNPTTGSTDVTLTGGVTPAPGGGDVGKILTVDAGPVLAFHNLTGDVTNSGSLATTIAANAVGNTKIRDSAGLSVIGRSANSTGDPADIVGVDGQVLRVSGTALGFGAITTALLPVGSSGASVPLGNDARFSITTASSSDEALNVGLATSVAASALTITLTQADGATAPAAGNSAVVAYTRGSPATSGLYTPAIATAATTLVVPSGATISSVSGTAIYLFVYAVNNGGVFELGISAKVLDQGTLQNSTAISAGSTSGTLLYTTTARTGVGVRLIGRILVNEATAGTWASNATEVSLAPFSKTITDVLGSAVVPAAGHVAEGATTILRLRVNATALTTATPANVAQSVFSFPLTPGQWLISGVVGFTAAAGTSITQLQAGVSKTSGTLPPANSTGVPNAGSTSTEYLHIWNMPATVPGVGDMIIPFPSYRAFVAANQSLFLVAQASFTVAGLNVYGWLDAYRIS